MFPYFILSWAIIGIKILVDGFMQVDHPVSISALYRVFYFPEAGYFLWFVYVLFLIFCIVPVFKSGNRLVLLSLLSLGLAFWDTAPEYFCIEQFCLNSIFFCIRNVGGPKIMDRASDIPVFYSLDCNYDRLLDHI